MVFKALQKYLHYWFALVIATALLFGYCFPELKKLTAIIPYLLFVMLYPMMINLRIEDIGKSFKNYKLVLISILVNFVISPLLGALWTYFLFHNVDPYLAAGFILKITVPCSGMVAAWTGYAKGKVESALVIVALSFVLSVFMVPFWMWLLAGVYVQIHPFMILNKMLIVVVAPLFAGLIARKWLVNLLFSKLLRLGYGNGIALAYSGTAKNHAIAIGLATTAFSGSLAVFPAAVAPVIQMPLMLLT